jgi:hypothetical protein
MRSASLKTSVVLGLAALLLVPGIALAESAAADHTPWSGYWWSLKDGYLFQGWDGTPGPTQRYDQYANANSTSWEQQNHYKPQGQGWEGHCHAWAAAAIMEEEPSHGAQAGGVDFRVGDLKGLITECHYSDQSSFHGNRSNAGPDGDLTPDQCWMVLRDYIRDRGVPVVMDLDPGAQVWNYPVYKYQVDYQGGQGQMTLWAADDDVSEDPEGPSMVGTIDLVKTYQFTCQMDGDDIVAGTGQWLGNDWPDFAWFPTQQVNGNPEIDVTKVREIAQLPDPGPGGGPPPPDGGQPPEPTPGADPLPGGTPPPPDGSGPPPPDVTPGPGGIDPGLAGGEWRDYIEYFPPHVRFALERLANRPPDFAVNVWPDRGDGATYYFGDQLVLRFRPERDCHIYLIAIDPDGTQTVLFPNPNAPDNFVQAGQAYQFPPPGARYSFDITPPAGIGAIKCIATAEPIVSRGVRLGLQKQGREPFQVIKNRPGQVLQGQWLKPQFEKMGKGAWSADVCIFFAEGDRGKLGKVKPPPKRRRMERKIRPPIKRGKPGKFGKPGQLQGKVPPPPSKGKAEFGKFAKPAK